MRAFAAIIAVQGGPSDKAAWDGAVLRSKGKELLTIKRPAKRRTPLLQAFQNAGWQLTIGYADSNTHLAQTIKDLNKIRKTNKAPIRAGRSSKGKSAKVFMEAVLNETASPPPSPFLPISPFDRRHLI